MWGRVHGAARRPQLRRVDWLLIALVVLLQTVAPRTGSEASANQAAWVGAAALVSALGQGAALVWRRRRPEATAAIVVSLYGASVLLVGLIPPLGAWVAIWTLASSVPDRRRALRAAGAATLATVAILVAGELSRAGSSASFLLGVVTVVVCLSAVIARSDRGRLDAVRQATAAEERLRIARDLHDLVGHGLSAVAVQSSTARLALAAGDESAALSALSAVEGSSRTAMREMRQLLGVLSPGSPPQDAQPADRPAPGLADLPVLVENIRAGGVAVTLHTDVDPSIVARSVQLCAYRVTQEALTNALKHSPGALVAVSAVTDLGADPGDRLRLRVETTGGESARGGTAREETANNGGAGIDGIHARVASVGGSAFVGVTDTGWLVEARLPLSTEGRG
jgi:signal transduction histidine kinase